MKKMIHRSIALAVAALWSLPAVAGDSLPPSVYVAPGGVYIGSAQVHVGNGHGYNGHSYNGGQGYVVPGAAYAPGYGPAPAYVPGYGPPVYAPGYAAPAYTPTYVPAPGYRVPRHAGYGARPARVYVSPYAQDYAPEYAPRPPAVVPYDGGNQCVVSHGRVYCN
jgi:hypothetical protein